MDKIKQIKLPTLFLRLTTILKQQQTVGIHPTDTHTFIYIKKVCYFHLQHSWTTVVE